MNRNLSHFREYKNLPSVREYASLKKKVADVLLLGHQRAQEAVENEKVRTYWEVGCLIESHVLQSGQRGDYGKKVIHQLATDLKTNQTLLYYALQFARTYKEIPSGKKISWSHYRALLPIKDDQKRNAFEAQIEEWGWSSRQLESAISTTKKTTAQAVTDFKKGMREAKPGKPYVYRVVSLVTRAKRKKLCIDLGFSNFYFVNLPKNVSKGDYLTAVKSKDSYQLIKGATLKEKDLHTYDATLGKVIDAQTIEMHLDLGFGISTYQRLFLRGVSVNEFAAQQSKQICQYMVEKLSHADSVLVKVFPQSVGQAAWADVFVDKTYLNFVLLKDTTS